MNPRGYYNYAGYPVPPYPYPYATTVPPYGYAPASAAAAPPLPPFVPRTTLPTATPAVSASLSGRICSSVGGSGTQHNSYTDDSRAKTQDLLRAHESAIRAQAEVRRLKLAQVQLQKESDEQKENDRRRIKTLLKALTKRILRLSFANKRTTTDEVISEMRVEQPFIEVSRKDRIVIRKLVNRWKPAPKRVKRKLRSKTQATVLSTEETSTSSPPKQSTRKRKLSKRKP